MKNFIWDEAKYNVGIKKFNEQHKQLLDALNDVYKAMQDKRDKLALAQVINNLRNYAKEHLAEEETMLLKTGYPHYKEHIAQHDLFNEKLNQFCEDFNSDKQMIHFEIAVFLKNWIINHILVTDKKYTEYLNSKGIY